MRHSPILSHVGGGPDRNLDALLQGQEPIGPVLVRLTSVIEDLGDDISVDREATLIAFSRAARFAVLEPASATRLDVRLALPGAAETERLRATDGFGTHLVSLAHEDEIDGELTGWLRDAYNAAST